MKTTETPQDEPSPAPKEVRDDVLLSLYGEQISRCLNNADKLDETIRQLPKTSENVDTHKRLAIKSGVWRSVAHDMKNTLKIALG